MLTANMSKISALIEQLLATVPIADLTDVVVFGSAAITLNGTDLDRSVDDLDLFASDETFARLRARRGTDEVEKKPGLFFLSVGIPKVEIWKTFPGVTHSEARDNARVLEGSHGLLVAALEELYAWKSAQPGEKHLNDLKRMRCAANQHI